MQGNEWGENGGSMRAGKLDTLTLQCTICMLFFPDLELLTLSNCLCFGEGQTNVPNVYCILKLWYCTCWNKWASYLQPGTIASKPRYSM